MEGRGGEVRRRRGKRLSMRVIQPSPQIAERHLYGGDVSEGGGDTGTSDSRRAAGFANVDVNCVQH